MLAVGEKLADLPDDHANHQARWKIIDLVHFTTNDIRYLLTPAFEPHLRRLIEEGSPDVSWIASDLAKRGLVAPLLYPAAVAADRRNRFESEHRDQRTCVTHRLVAGMVEAIDRSRSATTDSDVCSLFTRVPRSKRFS